MSFISQVVSITLIACYITVAEIQTCTRSCSRPFLCFWCDETCDTYLCYNDDCTFKGIVTLSAPACQPKLLKSINDRFGPLLEYTKTMLNLGLAVGAGFHPGANVAAIVGGALLDEWIPGNEPDYVTTAKLDEQWDDMLKCIDMAVDAERGTQAEYDFQNWNNQMENILEHMRDGLAFRDDLDTLFDTLVAAKAVWADAENYLELGKVIALIPAYTLAINVFSVTCTTHLAILYDESTCAEYNSALQHYYETLATYLNYITNALQTFDTYYEPTGFFCYGQSGSDKFQINWNEGNTGARIVNGYSAHTVPYYTWPRTSDCGINSCDADEQRVYDVIKTGFQEFRTSTNLPSLYDFTGEIFGLALEVDNDCSTHQMFRLEAYHSGHCITTFGELDTLGQDTCETDFSDVAQVWVKDAMDSNNEYFRIKNVHTDECIINRAGGPNYMFRRNENWNGNWYFLMHPCAGWTDQFWRKIWIDDQNFFHLQNKATGLCMFSNGDGRFGISVCVQSYSDQSWKENSGITLARTVNMKNDMDKYGYYGLKFEADSNNLKNRYAKNINDVGIGLIGVFVLGLLILSMYNINVLCKRNGYNAFNYTFGEESK